MRQIFPAARLTVIHLVRNPAAAINGLIDGWLDRGFFSHRLASPGPIAIHGYSDQSWGENWWNFDLPPSWESVMRRPLPSVCAFQWCSAHRAILQDVHSDNVRYIRVYAEELMFNRHERTTCIYQVLKEIGADPGAARHPRAPLTMATVHPRAGRWHKRNASLRQVLQSPDIQGMATQLGYSSSPDARWI